MSNLDMKKVVDEYNLEEPATLEVWVFEIIAIAIVVGVPWLLVSWIF